MTEIKLFAQKIIACTTMAIVGFTGVEALAVADVPPPDDIGSPTKRADAGSFEAPLPPDDIGEPGHRSDAGSRGCEDNRQLTSSRSKQLTALVPLYSSSGLVWGLTTAEHPTFWFYVPYSPRLATFVLLNEAGQNIYETPVTLAGTPGVISISLPSTAALLATGKRYHWFFTVEVECNLQQPPQQPPAFADGWIKRDSVKLALRGQLEKATLRQRVALYTANGVWYDALTAAAELHRTDPKAASWIALLRTVGLEAIASEPIVKCCQLKTPATANSR